MSGEIFGYIMERLMKAGALDVYYTPIMMKKNRPAIKVTILCSEKDEDKMIDILFQETTTLGVRKTKMERHILPRRFVKVPTKYGEVTVKVSGEGKQRKVAPEYDECSFLAQVKGVPLREVYVEAVAAAERMHYDENTGLDKQNDGGIDNG